MNKTLKDLLVLFGMGLGIVAILSVAWIAVPWYMDLPGWKENEFNYRVRNQLGKTAPALEPLWSDAVNIQTIEESANFYEQP